MSTRLSLNLPNKRSTRACAVLMSHGSANTSILTPRPSSSSSTPKTLPSLPRPTASITCWLRKSEIFTLIPHFHILLCEKLFKTLTLGSKLYSVVDVDNANLDRLVIQVQQERKVRVSRNAQLTRESHANSHLS